MAAVPGSLLKCLIPTIGAPAKVDGQEGRYALAAFYGELLGMKIVNEGWLLIAADPPSKFFVGLDDDGWDDRRPPRWPDPEYPQQMHLDVLVPDVDSAGAAAVAGGATLLRDNGDFRVYADPAGHPFCLYGDDSVDHAVVGRLVVDCYSPRALATFYEGFLGAHRRVEDSPDRVVIDLDDEALPDLAFQRAEFRAARWPDPDFPAQVHVDYRWHDSVTARAALERAEACGAIGLRPESGVYADPASHPFCIQNEIPASVDIVGLYINPPEYAVVYGVDGTSEHSGTGKGSVGSTRDAELAASDNATPFLKFLTQAESALPPDFELNLVCDWDGTFEDVAVQHWLSEHSSVQVHRNPPESSWDREVPRWVGYCARQSTDDDRTDAQALAADLESWMEDHERSADPFAWINRGPPPPPGTATI